MPIYEFFSPDTNRIYSFYARSLAAGKQTPRCPDDPKARMERMLSRFAVTKRERDTGAAERLEAPDPRMEQMMAEMEREISAMGDSEPDSRQLARLMRKMGDATGEKMPALMEEMISRMEQGEDPEAIEAEMGEAVDQLAEHPDALEAHHRVHALLAARRKNPSRDPKLYEMGDYI